MKAERPITASAGAADRADDYNGNVKTSWFRRLFDAATWAEGRTYMGRPANVSAGNEGVFLGAHPLVSSYSLVLAISIEPMASVVVRLKQW